MMHHRVKIVLLGGYPAVVDWTDGNPEGAIEMSGVFLSYIHEHTRRDAMAKAERIAPDVEHWITCLGI